MRRDVRRHADGDARGAIDEQVRELRREHDRLGLRAVVVRTERNGGLVEPRQQFGCGRRQAALGVAHRRGRIAIERSEVARAFDERNTQRKALRHPDERLVDRRVAVRVETAHDVADDGGALAVLRVGEEPRLHIV